MRSSTRLPQKNIPLLAGVGFIVFGLFTMQYGLSMVGGIFAGGIALVFLVTPKAPPKSRRWIRNILVVVVVGGDILFGFLARGTLPVSAASQVWTMHQIDNPGLLIPNGLDPADVNKDGFPDYLTNYEWDGQLRIAFHPGLSAVKDRWPAVTVGAIPNAESSALGDVDGDGNVDVVVAHGAEMGAQSGVMVIWGPSASRILDPTAWVSGGDIPTTVDQGQFNYVRCHDINKDGAPDIVVGGRGTSPRAGLKWIESPANPADRRSLANWQVHDIDSNVEGGYGFVFGDIDGDGAEDIALCNSDWDTSDDAKKLLYYQDPGDGTPAQKTTWPKTVIYQGPEFYYKQQVILYNLTGDAYPEIVMQTDEAFYIFQNPGGGGGAWPLIKIAKAPETCWRSRPLKVGDINQDGRPEIVGMLIHNEGILPRDKASVFWMNYSGVDPLAATWQTHPIKWAEGFVGIGTYNGEKWDQCLLEDVDRDGDMDIVANVEEYHTLGFVFLAVVWFENPLL